jgi:NADH:ubiquinone oxidoreductase subunit 3 (subunit A)
MKNIRSIGTVLIIASNHANAGLFLDLAVGAHLGCDAAQHVPSTSYECGQVAQQNPIGRVQVGYELREYQFRYFNIQPYADYTHISSIPTDAERGLNAVFVGVRLTR